jgi:branched-chain amino acid aminotransferase
LNFNILNINIMMNLDWKNLPFGYQKTDYNVRCYYRDGAWGELEISSSEYINMHMAATCLHYGQEAFEGMKAFRGVDGKIRIFRWNENAKRMRNSAYGIMMQEVTDELFLKAITTAIKLNERFIPPHGTGASLYIRPLLVGSGAQVGVKPASEYLFMVFVTPVGPYFKEGFNPVSVQIARDYDRAAPLGTGRYKVGGNYAASLRAGQRAHNEGFSAVLFLDAKEKNFIDEAGPANFFGIKDNTYITPLSDSILPSITNMSLMTLAEDMGMKVVRRPVPVDELGTFEEVGACGTAAVISPIGKIFDRDHAHIFEYCKEGKAGPKSTQLYNRLRGIQLGEMEDKFKWNYILE